MKEDGLYMQAAIDWAKTHPKGCPDCGSVFESSILVTAQGWECYACGRNLAPKRITWRFT